MHHLCRHHHHHDHHYHDHHYHYYYFHYHFYNETWSWVQACKNKISVLSSWLVSISLSSVKELNIQKSPCFKKSSCDWVSEKILNATLLANNSQHCFLLHVVGCSSTKFETGQTFSPVQTDTTFGRPTTANKVGRCCVRLHVAWSSFFLLLWFEFLFEELNFLCLNFVRSFIRGVFLIYNFAITLQSGKTRN